MSRRIGRNDPCSCGSGKKYKHCCARNEERLSLAARAWFGLIALMLLVGAWIALTSLDWR